MDVEDRKETNHSPKEIDRERERKNSRRPADGEEE